MTKRSEQPRLRPATLLAYSAMLAGTVGAFLWIRSIGDRRGASLLPPSDFGGARAGPADALVHVLAALVAVVVVARLLGALFRRFNQPPVIGEVLAGILLGPSLLGRVAPGVSTLLLPPTVAPFLGVMSQVGVILYMFLVGLELNTTLLKNRTHSSIAVSHASIIAPFLLGSALALWLYPRYAPGNVPFTVFALFLGVSMSVTAFPVLARILTDSRMNTTRTGTIALACAAVDDVTAWCLLAFVVSIARAEAGRVLLTVGLTLAFIVVMVTLVGPAIVRLVRWYERRGNLTRDAFTVVCVALLISALSTELIGIHALFGAFLLGALVPHDSQVVRDITGKLEDVIVVLFLPAFFAFTGMRTQIGLVHGLPEWGWCALIILVASIGKFGGSALAARVTGMDWRNAMGLGILMNTRGLMELIVLNVGLDLGVLSPTLFAMLVLMALVTTFATTPILHSLHLEQAPPAR